MTALFPNPCYNEKCYIRTALYLENIQSTDSVFFRQKIRIYDLQNCLTTSIRVMHTCVLFMSVQLKSGSNVLII